MNLIANSGIQFFTFPLEINLNDNFKMYFHEWYDVKDEHLKLEIAHYFTEDEIWVSKKDIYNLLGLGLTDGKVGRIEEGVFKPYNWDDIKSDFISDGKNTIKPMETDNGESDCFQMSVSRCRWEKFENQWLPFPFFTLCNNGKTEFAPTNWCRCKLIPEPTNGNIKRYNILLAFDTRTKYENEDFEEQDLMETPVFASNYDKFKEFALCNNEFTLVDFCSKVPYNCDWVDEYILNLFHDLKSVEKLNIKKPKLNYLAQFIFVIKYIQQLHLLPKITLFSDKNIAFGEVDLIVDMGNSRTCAVLFDNSDFTKVEHLGLYNLSKSIKNGKINIYNEPFDMRLAFRDAQFGVETLKGSKQFIFPSFVRLGIEANDLIHNAINLNTGVEKITTFSSPKRYLWDNKPQQKNWEFLILKDETNKNSLLQIMGVSEQLNSDGSLNATGEVVLDKCYSRKALMTFSFLEILAQAKMHINSYEFRHKWGEESKPRRIGRIIVTCPTAMSMIEQIAMRKCAEEASIILERFYTDASTIVDYEKIEQNSLKVIPSFKNLLHNVESKEWFYDEATCTQFVFLYAELTQRYRNNCQEYFDFYGKIRADLVSYNKKSITIGSVDIGAGTSDLMIAAYKYDDSGQCNLTPNPLFWESFYIAGDDLLINLIRRIVIEGEYAVIPNQLRKKNQNDIAKLILDYFGVNNARQSVQDRQLRCEFNLQVSIPVVTHYLEILRNNQVEKATFNFNDIFTENKPTEHVLEHFAKHFGFSITDLQWHYDKEIISKIVESTFETLVGKISTILSYYGCDIVLLAGKPSSLKPLSDLFFKYYAVSPNRLITLNNYRIGTWYPFHDGKGYFNDSKTIVAVGAMIGNYAATRGSLNGFSLDLSELKKEMKPTTEYFAMSENDNSFITPEINNAILEVSQLPIRIWTRQLDSKKYPTRPFYFLDFNEDKIKNKIKERLSLNPEDTRQINNAIVSEIDRLRKLSPFKVKIVRENYNEDKESLKLESVQDRNQNEVSVSCFLLQVQSMRENENYWMDSGEFSNISFNQI
ncbi:MAG: virulence factor SrfB [Limnohabitans sp.]|nr:virulence factor SrfB [Limnohabitans sp.]